MRLKTLLSLSAILSLSLSFGAMAQSPTFDYVQAGYTQVDVDEKMDGFHIEGSYSLTNHVFVRGEYQEASETFYTTRFDVDLTSLALGYQAAINDQTSYYAALSFEAMDAQAGPLKNDANGFGAYVGAKHFISPDVELFGELSYINIHDADISNVSYELGGQYHFDDAWSAGVSYRKLDDTALVNAGVRYAF